VMADLAQGRMRTKIDQLTEALTGRFNDHHRFMVQFRWRRIDQVTADIATLDRRIDELIEQHGYSAAVNLLISIPGVGQHSAQELLAELGGDMTVFPTPANLASWVGVAPGSHESAGVRKRVKARPGNRYAKRALGIAAMSATRAKSTFLSARYRRIRARQGHGKALVATMHSIVNAVWHILNNGDFYHDLGADYYNRRTPESRLRRKIKDLEAAGYTITKAA
jgi:transposase